MSGELLLKIVCRKKVQGNIWENQNRTGQFLAQPDPSNLFLKILFLVPKVSYFSEVKFYENYSRRVCIPIKVAFKAVIRAILSCQKI